jgi:RNA polymerase sigma-70 factor (ECF subfamily)
MSSGVRGSMRENLAYSRSQSGERLDSWRSPASVEDTRYIGVTGCGPAGVVTTTSTPFCFGREDRSVDYGAPFPLSHASVLDALERRLGDGLLLVARKHAFDPEEARDLYQTIWLHISQAISGYDGRAPVDHWARAIAVRVCQQHRRNRGRAARLADRFALEQASTPRVVSPFDRVGESVWGDLDPDSVYDAVVGLPPRQRTIFLFRVYVGMTFRDLAERFGLTEGGAKATFAKARNAVRQRLRIGGLARARARERERERERERNASARWWIPPAWRHPGHGVMRALVNQLCREGTIVRKRFDRRMSSRSANARRQAASSVVGSIHTAFRQRPEWIVGRVTYHGLASVGSGQPLYWSRSRW